MHIIYYQNILLTRQLLSDQKQKMHEHQTYYKAVSDNGYYPHFRKPRTTSSTSEDKVRWLGYNSLV